MSQVLTYWRASLKASGALAMIAGLSALLLVGCPQTGIGDACTPESEYREDFSGFTLDSAFIESRSFQCQTRLCLVNHFQGRVSCPRGQPAPTNCNPVGKVDGTCPSGQTCQFAGVIINNCDPTPCGTQGADPLNCNDPKSKSNKRCPGAAGTFRNCNQQGLYCECQDGDCPNGAYCDPSTKLCSSKVCTVLADAQKTPDKANYCFVPGTQIPIAVPVCGQCAASSNRDASHSVYCTCRCASPANNPSPADANYNFCKCPDGYECQEVNQNVGLGDPQLAGSYCVKQGTFVPPGPTPECGTVNGYVGKDANCQGTQKI